MAGRILIPVVVVGTGFGCRIHVPALRAAGFEVVGLVGANPERTARRARQNGVPDAFADLDQAISMTGAKAVTIATPPHTHCELVLEALRLGCHVLCEKPFARDSVEAFAMLTAAQRAGRVHLIGNEFRFIPQRATIARAIAEGMIGEPRIASFVQIAGVVKEWEEDFPDWWFDATEGGGWLGASGSHAIDQIRSWLGEFESVSASTSTVTLSRGAVEDSFSLRFRLKNGLEGILQQSAGAYGPLAELTEVAGEKGRIWLDGPVVRFSDGSGQRDIPVAAELELPEPPRLTNDPRNARDDWRAMADVEIAPYTELCGTFRALILGETPASSVSAASFADGLATMQVMDAIRKSAGNGGARMMVESRCGWNGTKLEAIQMRQKTTGEDEMETSRREIGQLLAAGMTAGALAKTSPAAATTDAGGEIAPSILEYLGDLDLAVAELAKTWKPDDPKYRADVYRQIMMNLSYAYFVYFNADPEHPDWAPMFNSVFMQQPNPDTLYVFSPLRGDLTYRVSGNRGTCHSLVFSTQHGLTGDLGSFQAYKNFNTFDTKNMVIGADGEFELILSAERPKGYTGNWAPILPDTDSLMVRYVAQDWGRERDPQLSIECLDKVPPKPRLTPDQIIARIRKMAMLPANMDRIFFWQQDDLKQRAGVNKFELQHLTGVEFQYYWPAAFEFSPGEALIVETELPEVRPYWNLQLNDPYFNAIDYVYRLSCTNGHFAKVSSDGKFRAVVALEDPGVPNWLDTAGFTEGTLWGRWYDCSSTPLPTLKRVPFDKIRDHLPPDTPYVTPRQRAEELRERVRACQRRRRW